MPNLNQVDPNSTLPAALTTRAYDLANWNDHPAHVASYPVWKPDTSPQRFEMDCLAAIRTLPPLGPHEHLNPWAIARALIDHFDYQPAFAQTTFAQIYHDVETERSWDDSPWFAGAFDAGMCQYVPIAEYSSVWREDAGAA